MKMCKYFVILMAIVVACSCKQKATNASGDNVTEVEDTTTTTGANEHAVSPEQLITPGKAIGHIQLGSGLDSIVKVLGRPDTGDAAMGAELATWYANHDTTGYQTSVYARSSMGNKDEAIKRIKNILITSPWFKTAEYISTGNTKADIAKYYTLTKGSTYTVKGQTIQVYTDKAKGISFETDPADKCVSIVIHAPNTDANTYINMH